MNIVKTLNTVIFILCFLGLISCNRNREDKYAGKSRNIFFLSVDALIIINRIIWLSGKIQFVKSGDNELKIEIVNLWVNRMTGDMLSDPKDRYCRTNQTYMKSEVWLGGDEPFRLQAAGVLGPVTLNWRNY